MKMKNLILNFSDHGARIVVNDGHFHNRVKAGWCTAVHPIIAHALGYLNGVGYSTGTGVSFILGFPEIVNIKSE
jgi:hypothetical protein